MFSPFMPSGLIYINPFFVNIGSVCLDSIVIMFYSNSCPKCKQFRPDRTPRSAASDLDLHYLSMTILLETRHKWVKCIKYG